MAPLARQSLWRSQYVWAAIIAAVGAIGASLVGVYNDQLRALTAPRCAPSRDALGGAALDGDKETLSCLIEYAGMDVNQIADGEGNSALLIAASNCNLTLVRYLLDQKASKYHRNTAGKTAASLAKERCGYRDELWKPLEVLLRRPNPPTDVQFE